MNRNELVSVARPHKAAMRSLQAARLLHALIGLLVILPAAQAAVVLESHHRVVDLRTIEPGGGSVINVGEVNPPFTSEFIASVAIPGELAQQRTVIDLVSESGIIAGASGYGSVMSTANSAVVSSRLAMAFNVTERPVNVLLRMQMTANGQPQVGTGSAFNRNSFDGTNFETLHSLFAGPLFFNAPLGTVSDTFEAELDIGRYELFFQTDVQLPSGAANGIWKFDLIFDPIRWENAVSGNFQTGGNWSSGAPPSGTDNAIIDRPGTYTVSLAGDAAHKALFANGPGVNVTIDANGFDYVLDEISLGGLDGDSGTITFADSSDVVVSVASAFAGDGPMPAAANSDPGPSLRAQLLKAGKGWDANVTIPIATTDGTIDATGRVNVKGVNGRWEVTHLTMGEVDQGTLEISADGNVISNSAVVGKNLFSFNLSTATVTGQGSIWDTQTLVVGERGLGFLHIQDKGIVTARDIVIGSAAGSGGAILVENSAQLLQNSTDNLRIAVAGTGSLEVKSGSRVAAGNLFMGGSSAFESVATVGSGGLLEVFGSLSVGANARLVVDGGRVERKHLDGPVTFTSIERGGQLLVNAGHFYENGLLEVIGVMSIHPTLGSASVGQLSIATPGQLTIVPGGTLSGNGTLRGNLEVIGGVDNSQVNVDPGTSPGTLTIDGDYEQTGGLLRIEIAGTAPGQFDVLAVTGTATLGGTLRLEFIDDFAPRQGDEFKFLDIGGALSGAFDEIEVRNLGRGFQFDLRPDAGGMTMVALNDGVFVPEPATLAMLVAGVLTMCSRRGATRYFAA